MGPGGGYGDLDAAGRELAPCPAQFFDDAAPAGHCPLIDPACGGFSHPLDQRQARNGRGVANPDAGQAGHQLPGAARADAEEFLDPLAVELAGVHVVEQVKNFRKSVKPRGFGRHRAGGDSTTGKGAIRHYRIFGKRGAGLVMNDKGPYHTYRMAPDRSQDLLPALRSATPIPAERIGAGRLPALLAPDPDTERRVIEFFTAHIRNPNSRRAYARAAAGFDAWSESHGITHLRAVKPVHVADWVEELQHRMAAPSVKLHLAGIRMLFDWLVLGQVIPLNPASAVRGPKHSVRKGKTPVLTATEARDLLASIVTDTRTGLRDRALIALMIYTFARVGATLKMRAEDVFIQGHRTWVRLGEKGCKHHEMPRHHKLESYLQDYAAARPSAAPPQTPRSGSSPPPKVPPGASHTGPWPRPTPTA